MRESVLTGNLIKYFMNTKVQCGVYRIHNLVNDKSYVGQSREVPRRWIFHLWELRNGIHTNKGLQNDWNYYGEPNFVFEILQECNSQEQLWEQEEYFIQLLDSYENGYNLTLGGRQNFGTRVDPETSKRIGAMNREHMYGTFATMESRLKRSASLKGIVRSPESAQKVSESMKKNAQFRSGIKLTLEEKLEIFNLHSQRVPIQEICDKCHVSRSTINRAVHTILDLKEKGEI